jgi:hypothetical protein
MLPVILYGVTIIMTASVQQRRERVIEKGNRWSLVFYILGGAELNN